MFGLLGKWLGGGKAETSPETATGATVSYNGFEIIPEPYRAQGQWQLAARIRKEIDGELREHHLVRADLLTDAQQAGEHAVMKAKRVIDEQGDGLFG